MSSYAWTIIQHFAICGEVAFFFYPFTNRDPKTCFSLVFWLSTISNPLLASRPFTPFTGQSWIVFSDLSSTNAIRKYEGLILEAAETV